MIQFIFRPLFKFVMAYFSTSYHNYWHQLKRNVYWHFRLCNWNYRFVKSSFIPDVTAETQQSVKNLISHLIQKNHSTLCTLSLPDTIIIFNSNTEIPITNAFDQYLQLFNGYNEVSIRYGLDITKNYYNSSCSWSQLGRTIQFTFMREKQESYSWPF